MMKLPRAGREYVYWDFDAHGDTLTTAHVYLNSTWNTATISGSTVSLLVAGPDATSNPGGTVVLAAGTHSPLIRFTDSPELVVRAGGEIVVS